MYDILFGDMIVYNMQVWYCCVLFEIPLKFMTLRIIPAIPTILKELVKDYIALHYQIFFIMKENYTMYCGLSNKYVETFGAWFVFRFNSFYIVMHRSLCLTFHI